MDAIIHKTAIIEEGAQIKKNVRIGPYCHIGSHVVLEEDVEIHAHTVIAGNTTIGRGTKVFSFSCIGYLPQVTGIQSVETAVIIGENNLIREYVTIHPGTPKGRGVTQVGNNCMIMVSSHIAHDCKVGNNVIMANQATLGGHVEIEDFVNIGGLSGIHQFVKLGRGCIIGGLSGVEGHVIPYGSVIGNRARLSGLNLVGLKRRHVDRDRIHALRAAYRLLFANEGEGSLSERILDVEEMFAQETEVMEIVDFLRQNSNTLRPLCLP